MKRATAKIVADFGDDLVKYRVHCPFCGCVNNYYNLTSDPREVIGCEECEEIIGIRYEQ